MPPKTKKPRKAAKDEGYISNYDSSGGYPDPREVDPVTSKQLPDRFPSGWAEEQALKHSRNPSPAPESSDDEVYQIVFPHNPLETAAELNARDYVRMKEWLADETALDPKSPKARQDSEESFLGVEEEGSFDDVAVDDVVEVKARARLLRLQAQVVKTASESLSARYPLLEKAIDSLIQEVDKVEEFEEARAVQARKGKDTVARWSMEKSKKRPARKAVAASAPVTKPSSKAGVSKSTKAPAAVSKRRH